MQAWSRTAVKNSQPRLLMPRSPACKWPGPYCGHEDKLLVFICITRDMNIDMNICMLLIYIYTIIYTLYQYSTGIKYKHKCLYSPCEAQNLSMSVF